MNQEPVAPEQINEQIAQLTESFFEGLLGNLHNDDLKKMSPQQLAAVELILQQANIDIAAYVAKMRSALSVVYNENDDCMQITREEIIQK